MAKHENQNVQIALYRLVDAANALMDSFKETENEHYKSAAMLVCRLHNALVFGHSYSVTVKAQEFDRANENFDFAD